jgi:glycosylphosphatidylinositol transamidase
MSNLLERLHASFFLYIMTTPSSFLKIGSYLPSVVLVATALIFGGLREWVSAGWVELEDEHQSPGHGKAADIGETPKTWVPRRRNLLDAFVVIAASHLIGLILFLIICQGWSGSHRLVCRSILVASCYWLMFKSERHNPTCLLDNPCTRPMGVSFA